MQPLPTTKIHSPLRSNLVLGLSGHELNIEEQRWLRENPPAGIILFARNAVSPEQIGRLIDEARQCAGCALQVAIDEEGGRVNRLPWPPFRGRPSASDIGRAHRAAPEKARQIAYDDARRCGEALAELGFTHNCAPVLDLYCPDGDAIIGERAYGSDPETVAELAGAVMRGLEAGGVEAIGKHFPGHGRANCDSHLATPEVTEDTETLLHEAKPFARLITAGIRNLMTAHVRYPLQDDAIATFSRYWLRLLREQLGFHGTIWSDDLSMGGAGDDLAAALNRAKAAGCERLLVCQPEDCRAIFRGDIF